jgi:hypothetical protein
MEVEEIGVWWRFSPSVLTVDLVGGDRGARVLDLLPGGLIWCFWP